MCFEVWGPKEVVVQLRQDVMRFSSESIRSPAKTGIFDTSTVCLLSWPRSLTIDSSPSSVLSIHIANLCLVFIYIECQYFRKSLEK